MGSTVTRIEEFKKGRYRVYIDGVRSFILYRGELRTYHIEEGQVIAQEILDTIYNKVLPKRAKLRSMNLLMKRRLTEYELRQKLIEGEYPEDTIAEAMQYVISYGYIDDRSYAEDFIVYNKDSKSVTRMTNDLVKKGIDRELIKSVLIDIQDSSDPVDEENQIHKLLLKKHYDPSTATYEETQKVYAFLCRKGYSSECIRQAMHVLDITSEYV